MNVLAPLFNFNWDGDHFDLEKLGKIQLQQSMPDLSNFKSSFVIKKGLGDNFVF